MTPEQQTVFDQFIEALRKTPREWKLEKVGLGNAIRTDFATCPYLQVGRVREYDKLMDQINKLHVAHQIWYAADERLVHNPEIRAALLDACGLTEHA